MESDTLRESAISMNLKENCMTPARIDDLILSVTERKPPLAWYIAFGFTSAIFTLGMILIGITFYYGIGKWGNNSPVFWGFDITNFVFWIGIGHAGTLISAILFLFRQRWRNAIARFAEAMTLFAVMCAGLFPFIHVGRPWVIFWVFPYPNARSLWVNFRSPLLWDVFAVSTYFTVSALFWYVGLIPDFASLRDRANGKIRHLIFTILSLGWSGASRHWVHYEKAYMILAGLATPLVLSVHSVVSFDFAVSVIPGWHSTIFPPYFVAGAIFSGFAMVVTVLVIVRKVLNMENVITLNHLDAMNKVILATGSMVGYAYLVEIFMAWYSGNPIERYVFINRAFGHYAWAFWVMTSCNVLFPQLFWFKRIRRSVYAMFIIAVLVNLGMWLERFVIIVSSLHRDYLPSSWGIYRPTLYDIGILIGSFGLFFMLILLFARLIPIISTTEVKADLFIGQQKGVVDG